MHEHVPNIASHLELGEFVRGLAHDIANPLNSMAMNAELTKVLLDRGDTAAVRECLEHLLADCARCGQLVQRFQAFGAALQASSPQTVTAGTLLRSSIELMQSEVADAGVEFRIDGAADTSLRIDRPAMERALAGILLNAAEAGANTVDIRVATEADRVRVQIADNGSGIEMRWLERVAEPFFSTRRAQGASGLGLTLAREIVRRHGGSLDVQSGSEGTVVRIELPTATDS